MKAKKTNENCEKIVFIGVMILILVIGFTVAESWFEFLKIK